MLARSRIYWPIVAWLKYGLDSVNALIGMTAREFLIEDACQRRKRFRLNPVVIHFQKYATERNEQLEAKVLSDKRIVSINCINFDFGGFIHLANLIKLPVLDHRKEKTVAFITLFHNLTAQMSLSVLFQCYQQYYPAPIAVELLSKYLKIDQYFTKLPTVKEMQVLLAMRQHPNRKRIARHLNIACNTVASHVQHIKDKLIVPDYEAVLVQLRKAAADQGVDNRNSYDLPDLNVCSSV